MIECHALTKNFRSYQKEPGLLGSFKSFFKRKHSLRCAVDQFDLNVGKGEMLGLLGPNGAGKTTLMKMFTGIIAPSHGQLKILGQTPFERSIEFRKKIALVMGQKSQLWWDIPALDSFRLLQRYYEIPEAKFHSRLEHFVDILDVGHVLKVHVRKLSLGERMKMELMASLLHEPELIFLDEPTIGLDLVAQSKIRTFIKEYQRSYGATIILTSHYMADVDALCSRIVLILKGQKRFDGNIKEFESILGKEKFMTISFSKSVNPELSMWKELDAQWSSDFQKVDIRLAEDKLCSFTQQLVSELPVTDINTEKLPIERVMSSLMHNPELLESH